jgi:hypothetical protein
MTKLLGALRIASVVIGLLAISGSAMAQSQGRWLCLECELGPVGSLGGAAVKDAIEVIGFIKSTVNLIRKTDWAPNQTVDVCNGKTCVTMLYTANGNFIPSGPSTADSGGAYKNVSAAASKKGSVAPQPDGFQKAQWRVEITGHWEYTQWTSDGVDCGRSPDYFVIDSAQFYFIGGSGSTADAATNQ